MDKETPNSNPFAAPEQQNMQSDLSAFWLYTYILWAIPSGLWDAAEQVFFFLDVEIHPGVNLITSIIGSLLFAMAIGDLARLARLLTLRFAQLLAAIAGLCMITMYWYRTFPVEGTSDIGGLYLWAALLYRIVFILLFLRAGRFPGRVGRVRWLALFDFSVFFQFLVLATFVSIYPDYLFIEFPVLMLIHGISFWLWFRAFWSYDFRQAHDYALALKKPRDVK